MYSYSVKKDMQCCESCTNRLAVTFCVLGGFFRLKFLIVPFFYNNSLINSNVLYLITKYTSILTSIPEIKAEPFGKSSKI